MYSEEAAYHLYYDKSTIGTKASARSEWTQSCTTMEKVEMEKLGEAEDVDADIDTWVSKSSRRQMNQLAKEGSVNDMLLVAGALCYVPPGTWPYFYNPGDVRASLVLVVHVSVSLLDSCIDEARPKVLAEYRALLSADKDARPRCFSRFDGLLAQLEMQWS